MTSEHEAGVVSGWGGTQDPEQGRQGGGRLGNGRGLAFAGSRLTHCAVDGGVGASVGSHQGPPQCTECPTTYPHGGDL